MNGKTLSLLLFLGSLSGCSSFSTLTELEKGQQNTSQLIEQQSMRMEMQEEYLAQLAESQQELVSVLERIDRRTRQLKVQTSRKADGSPGDSTDKVADEPVTVEPVSEVVRALENKQVVGRNEWAWLELLGRNLKARVDTGALSSSLSAIDLLPFERDGHEWIRFRVPDEDHPDGGDVYEAPLVKYVKVRQASADELERRPVVRLTVRVGDFVDDTEFSLTNREDMLYPLLLGRNFLRDVALVDVAQQFTQPKYVPDTSTVEPK